MHPSTVLLLAFLIGILSGFRTFTPVAAVAWAAYAHWLKLTGALLPWLGTLPAAIVFTIAALLELFYDKRPATAARTAPPAFIARLLMGALCGAAVTCAGYQSMLLGAIFGTIGAGAGTLGGYHARKGLVKAIGCPDRVIALLEDAVTIGVSVWLVSRF